MKTTIELPDEILERTKIAAARRRTTIRKLVIEGLESVLKEEPVGLQTEAALIRLKTGYHLGGQPISRDQAHVR